MIVVDTNVWIEFLKRPASTVGDRLRDLIKENRATLVGIVLTEVLRGIRNDEQRRLVNHVLDGIPYYETTRKIFARAGEIARELDAAGTPIPTNDALVGAIAIEGGHEIFTLDRRHFERIPGVRLYQPQGDDDA